MLCQTFSTNPRCLVVPLRPIVAIDSDILVTKVAEPILGVLGAGAQIDLDLEILVLEQARGTLLIDRLGLAVDQQLQLALGLGLGRGGRHEADVGLGWDDGVARAQVRRVADRAQDAAPVRILAVQGGFDQGRARDRRRNQARVARGRRVADADLDKFRGALAVAHHELRESLCEGRQDRRHGRVVGR